MSVRPLLCPVIKVLDNDSLAACESSVKDDYNLSGLQTAGQRKGRTNIKIIRRIPTCVTTQAHQSQRITIRTLQTVIRADTHQKWTITIQSTGKQGLQTTIGFFVRRKDSGPKRPNNHELTTTAPPVHDKALITRWGMSSPQNNLQLHHCA